MFEGKHIHYSPTDNKPLCSYSGKICRQRRLNGYAFCIRHILEDKSAPFKQCSFVTRNNSQKCLNAIPTNQDRGYCHSHMQVAGIIPKTERKSKAQPVKSESNSSSNPTSEKSTSAGNNLKKDPSAVFKFEEDSSEIAEVFSYKNGISNSSPNGKERGSKGKEYGSLPKDIKHVKSQSGSNSLPSFTTKKITDKNKNVYTAIIPTNNSVSHKAQSRNKNNTNKATTEDSLSNSQPKSSSRVVHLSIRVQKNSNQESELKSRNAEEIRQFEQLKTLKQLDKSFRISNISNDEGGYAKLENFPRLAAKSSSIPKNGISSRTTNHHFKLEDSPTYEGRKREIVFTSPAPPLITRSSNGIIIKTEPQTVAPEGIDTKCIVHEDGNTLVGKQHDDGVLLSSLKNKISNSGHNNCFNSIDRDLKTRHEFLAHVRNTFKSQYKTIKKACKVSEKCEKNSKQRFRDSLMRCVRIDSSICAQVLSGYGLKLPSSTLVKTDFDAEKEDIKKDEYDSYEFFDSDDTSPATASIEHKSSRKSTYNTNPCKKVSGKDSKKVEDGSKIQKDIKTKAQRRLNSCVKGKDIDASPTAVFEFSSKLSKDEDEFDRTTISSKTVKVNKRADKSRSVVEIPKESKLLAIAPTKKKLRRGDAIVLTSEDSIGSQSLNGNESSKCSTEDIGCAASGSFQSSINPANAVVNAGKKRRLDMSDVNIRSELGLVVSGQPSPSLCHLSSAFDITDHINSSSTEVGLLDKCEVIEDRNQTASLHHNLNRGVSNPINEVQELQDILSHSQLSSTTSRHNQGLETVLNSVGSSENAGTPDGVITDASFDSTFEHSTSSQPECEFSEDDLEHSFELQIDPEIESQASRLLEDNVLTEADFTELFPDNRMSDHKFGRNDLQELGMAGLEFDVNDIDYSLFANIFPNFPRSSQPESISISNQF